VDDGIYRVGSCDEVEQSCVFGPRDEGHIVRPLSPPAPIRLLWCGARRRQRDGAKGKSKVRWIMTMT